MINKRLLIKNLLAHSDENSFYDKKRNLYLSEKEGKAKFLKHVCALANSNPENNSYIVVGVEDEDNEILGVDFFDDSRIQNLVNAYLDNPPRISYENIPFPHLLEGKVVGLVSIRSSGASCSLKKGIWKYKTGTFFIREGSISMPKSKLEELIDTNSDLVATIEQHARNNIELTLDGVIDFINTSHKDLTSHYKVFKEQYVVCWAGKENKVDGQVYYSRVDIELINEQVKLFYSDLDEVSITYDEASFSILEYVHLGLGNQQEYYPLEKVVITFGDNGTYAMHTNLVFEPPKYDKETLKEIYQKNKKVLQKITQKKALNEEEEAILEQLPETYLLCYLNGFEDAKDEITRARKLLKNKNSMAYRSSKEALRIIRKIRYN